MKTISFARVNEEIKIPTKRVGDAGYDIYPYFQEEFMLISHTKQKSFLLDCILCLIKIMWSFLKKGARQEQKELGNAAVQSVKLGENEIEF